MNKTLIGLSALLVSFPAFSAIPVDLSSQSTSFLMNKKFEMKEKNRSVDFNQTLHIRMVETFQGHPVWGGDAIVHIPQVGNSKKPLMAIVTKDTSMDGIVYQDIDRDLSSTPSHVFASSQMQNAVAHAVTLFQQKTGNHTQINDTKSKLIVFFDKNNKAHWAFHVSFFVPSISRELPSRPTYILDAKDFFVYKTWNDLKTLDNVDAGGFGGNHKTGKMIFDGLTGHASKLEMQRDAASNKCYMQNDYFAVKDQRNNQSVMSFPCELTNPDYNNVYWNGNHDQVLTTWSPSNDALFGAQVTRDMFRDWYNMPMLVDEDGKSMFLPIIVHDPVENAYWDSKKVLLGDSEGSDWFNPFTQLDTVGHEICHGFTEQHSGLEYYEQSGGLNEAFSDMAGMATEYYAFGKTKYLVGWGDVQAEGKALRYMDQPSKDCEGREPGDWCSIDHMSQYNDLIDVHYSSGIFNRVYYLLANTSGWNAKKAFDVMVQANMYYWTPTTTFAKAACGVMKAAKDYKYDLRAVFKAFRMVGINTRSCS
ncbi:MAG: M4 family metallopeptidase [Gammaproteobacteria bacterium]|nr:M4 family metallopeptidase [Gammaproteobacteria bacterium]MCW5583326.1 M4 family metallopeptidase [Gammaproteobacteria bacterium]